VDRVRRAIGRRLAAECPAEGDVVIPVPDSNNSIALGYSEGSGIRYEPGLIRNHYVGCTFILPGDRDLGVRIKFNPVRGALAGRRVVAVDDSIVRGTTLRRLVGRLREAGAREVHVRVGSPPITHACYYGIDTAQRCELIGARRSVPEIREFLGVETLGYLSLEGLLACERAPGDFCRSCFTGDYPLAVDTAAGKLALEELHGSARPGDAARD
jgi:amidophosphoribosyltransferase